MLEGKGVFVGIDVAVGGIGVGVAGALHPTKNKRINPILVICCEKLWWFIVASFCLRAALSETERRADDNPERLPIQTPANRDGQSARGVSRVGCNEGWAALHLRYLYLRLTQTLAQSNSLP